MILLSAEAISDIQRVREFLEEQNPPAAQRAMAAIWAASTASSGFQSSADR